MNIDLAYAFVLVLTMRQTVAAARSPNPQADISQMHNSARALALFSFIRGTFHINVYPLSFVGPGQSNKPGTEASVNPNRRRFYTMIKSRRARFYVRVCV